MADSADNLHIESEGPSPAKEINPTGMAKEDGVKMDRLDTPQGPAPPVDSGPGCETCPVEEERPRSPHAAEDPASDVAISVCSAKPAQTPAAGSSRQPPPPSRVSLAEMDCLICFNRYGPSRLPKVLACQHAFCAVCLKLLLRNEDRTWVIGCPLCRKATVVFGGLVCSLRDKEDVVGRLETPGLDAEAARLPDLPGVSHARRQTALESGEPPSGGTNREAAKRLVLLLLLVALLIVLILPFLYTGLLKWALCFVVVLGLAVSVVLCCNPGWCCSALPLPSWRKKESPVASVA